MTKKKLKKKFKNEDKKDSKEKKGSYNISFFEWQNSWNFIGKQKKKKEERLSVSYQFHTLHKNHTIFQKKANKVIIICLSCVFGGVAQLFAWNFLFVLVILFFVLFLDFEQNENSKTK